MTKDAEEGVSFIYDFYTVINKALKEVYQSDGHMPQDVQLGIYFDTDASKIVMGFYNAAGEPLGTDKAQHLESLLFIHSESSQEDIKRAIRTARAAYHADKYNHLPQDQKDDAAAKYALIDKAAHTLTGDKKPEYDELLHTFYAERQHRVHYKPDQNISFAQHTDTDLLSLDDILNGNFPEPPDEMLQLLETWNTVDDDDLAELRANYSANPTDERIKNKYKKALETRANYLAGKEKLGAGRIGLLDAIKPLPSLVSSSEQYVGSIEDGIEAQQARIAEQVQDHQRALTAGLSQPIALLSSGENAESTHEQPSSNLPAPMTEEQMAKIIKAAQNKIEQRADDLRTASKERASLLEELAALSDIECLKPGDPSSQERIILHVLENKSGEKILTVAFRLDMANSDLGEHDTLQDSAMQDIRSLDLDGLDHVYSITHNPKVEFPLMEVIAAAEILSDPAELERRFSVQLPDKPLQQNLADNSRKINTLLVGAFILAAVTVGDCVYEATKSPAQPQSGNDNAITFTATVSAEPSQP